MGLGGDPLLGTDFQPKLVFSLIMETPEKSVDILTVEQCRSHGMVEVSLTSQTAAHPQPTDAETPSRSSG